MNNHASISIKRSPERVELIKRMVDSNPAVAFDAQTAFAKFLRGPIQQVFNQRSTAGAVYRTLPFSENDHLTIPLDTYLGTKEKHVRVWSQAIAGGLPTNLIQGLGEYPFTTYRLDSAVSFYNEYIKNANLPVLSAGIERMINEIVVKQEINAWAPLLNAVAVASTNNVSHVQNSTIAGQFLLEDFNKILIRLSRVWQSYANGTPDLVPSRGVTDMFVSPEIMGKIRAWAYNPMNTRGGYKSDGTESVSGVPLPDDVRESIMRTGGLAEIYGVRLHQLLEFGQNAKFNTIFDNAYQGSFNPATQEVVLGVDASRDVILRPVITDDEDGGGEIVVKPDNQFFDRSEKTGFYTKLREGRILLDDRVLSALIV